MNIHDRQDLRPVIKDLKTGQERRAEHGASLYWWSDGNGSCDCNRRLVFGMRSDSAVCYGSKRFIVVDVPDVPQRDRADAIAEMNSDYEGACPCHFGVEVIGQHRCGKVTLGTETKLP